MTVKDDVDVAVDSKVGQQPASESETPKQATQNERQAVWGDYFRVFTYAKKWDFVLMFGAAVASLAGGVVSPRNPTPTRTLELMSMADHASHERDFRSSGWEFYLVWHTGLGRYSGKSLSLLPTLPVLLGPNSTISRRPSSGHSTTNVS